MAGRRRRRSVKRILGQAVAGLVLLAVLLVAVLAFVVPAVTGGQALTVLTGSMSPAINQGDLIVVRGVSDPDSIEVGDIITFKPEVDGDTLLTHRVVAEGNAGSQGHFFTTKGDAFDVTDQPVFDAQVEGKYLYRLPKLGQVAEWTRSHAAWVVVAVGLLLILWALWAFATPAKGAKRSKPAAPAKRPAATSSRHEVPPAPPAGGKHRAPGPADVEPVHRRAAQPAPPPVPVPESTAAVLEHARQPDARTEPAAGAVVSTTASTEAPVGTVAGPAASTDAASTMVLYAVPAGLIAQPEGDDVTPVRGIGRVEETPPTPPPAAPSDPGPEPEPEPEPEPGPEPEPEGEDDGDWDWDPDLPVPPWKAVPGT